MDREDQIQTIVEVLAKLQRPSLNSGWHKLGLSHAQMGMLYLLYFHNKSSVKEAADFLGITKSAVTQLAGPLADKGLLTREEDAKDRRIVRLRLTGKGAQVLKKIARHKFDGIRSAIENLSDKEVEKLCALVKKAAGAISTTNTK